MKLYISIFFYKLLNSLAVISILVFLFGVGLKLNGEFFKNKQMTSLWMLMSLSACAIAIMDIHRLKRVIYIQRSKYRFTNKRIFFICLSFILLISFLIYNSQNQLPTL